MGLDVFFCSDIRNALMAADEASTSMARVCAAVGGDGRDESVTRLYLRAYLEGYRAQGNCVYKLWAFRPPRFTK